MKCMLKKSKKVPITFLERSLYNALSTSRQFFANKYTTSADTWNMSRLNAESVTKTGSKFQVDSTRTRQQNTDDDIAERSTSCWLADRRCWRPATTAVDVQQTIQRVQYGGAEAIPWRLWYISTANLNRTRSVTSSQWSSSRSSRDKDAIELSSVLPTRAAEFITRRSLSVMTLG